MVDDGLKSCLRRMGWPGFRDKSHCAQFFGRKSAATNLRRLMHRPVSLRGVDKVRNDWMHETLASDLKNSRHFGEQIMLIRLRDNAASSVFFDRVFSPKRWPKNCLWTCSVTRPDKDGTNPGGLRREESGVAIPIRRGSRVKCTRLQRCQNVVAALSVDLLASSQMARSP